MTDPQNSDNDFTLWRYMDLAKFISLLQTKSLYFSSGYKLNRSDRFEFNYSSLDYKLILECINAMKLMIDKTLANQEDIDLVMNSLNEMIRYFSQIIGVNSWIISEHQSNAMWKIYSKSDGIAIKTKMSKIYKSLNEKNPYREIYHQGIIYQDILNSNIINDYLSLFESLGLYDKYLKGSLEEPEKNTFKWKLYQACFPIIFNKTRPFSYENEYRFITLLNFPANMLDLNIEGNLLEIDLNYVIDEVLVAPDAEEWFHTIVQNLMDTYMLDQSKLINHKLLIPSAC